MSFVLLGKTKLKQKSWEKSEFVIVRVVNIRVIGSSTN